MALIKDTSVDAVKAAADILDVVGARTQLKKAGARYVGRCPFHEERTPSFSVNPVDKLYHCFGCGAGGDLIKFVQETENVDFAGAVEWLADRFRVTLEYEQSSPEADRTRQRRDRLGALLDQAASFYDRYLWEAAGAEEARAYLDGRGLSEAVCREYRLGYAPGGQTLATKARERGFTADELSATGLVNRRGNDYFSRRIVFPLADARGRVRGFQARKLREDDPIQAKYVNSPESDLFRKGAMLYGLDLARTSIAKQNRGVVVEGNPDVLALRQAGFEPVVASMGTALTQVQLTELRRLTSHLVLCFDADAAGAEATLRGMDLAYRTFDEVRVVTLPPGEDPASAPDAFLRLLESAESYPRHRVKLEIDRASSKEDAFQRVRAIVAGLERNTEWLEAIEYAADRLDLPPELQAGLAPRNRAFAGTVSEKVLARADRYERDALAACIAFPSLRQLLGELHEDDFGSAQHRRFRAVLLGKEELDEDLRGLYAELDARLEAEGINESAGKSALLRLRERRLQHEIAAADSGEMVRELTETLARVRRTISELGFQQAGASAGG